MSGLPPLPGHPEAVRLLADRLTTTARRLSALAGALARLRDGATWDGPAGDAFGGRLHDVVPVLDAVAVRLGGAGPPLRALAQAMEGAQAVTSRAVLDLDEAEHAYAVLEDRVVALAATGADEGSPEVLVVRDLQTEQVRVQGDARARHAVAAERFREADQRCAAVLHSLSVDGIADSLPYRVVAGLGSAGHDVSHRRVDPLLVSVLEAGDLPLPRVELLGPFVESTFAAAEVLIPQGGLLEAAFLLDIG